MKSGRLAAFLAVVLTTGCASFRRVPAPNWQRYEQGELAGFLQAPGERPVETLPDAVVRRVRGHVVINGDDRDQLQVRTYRVAQPRATSHDPDVDRGGSEQLADGFVFVVELRASGSDHVRTLASRGGLFDFGPLPDGTYTLKAVVVGWRAAVTSITVSQSADTDARLKILLSPAG